VRDDPDRGGRVGIHPPRLPDPTAEAVEPVGHSRRGFLTRVAVGGAALAVGSQVVPVGGLLPTGAQEEDEVALEPHEVTVQLLASIALAASAAHRVAADQADVAETTVEVIRLFGSHHRSQAADFNALIPEEAVVEVPNATLLAEVTGALEGAGDEAATLGVLRDLAERIVATHLTAIEEAEATDEGTVKGVREQNDDRTIAAAMATVSQQAVVLALLGGQSVEDASPEVQTAEGALTIEAYPVTFPEEEGADAAAAEEAGDEAAPAEEEGSTTTAGDGEDADTTTTTTEG
jgi:hypothetical protein